jgi:hypothetical protein
MPFIPDPNYPQTEARLVRSLSVQLRAVLQDAASGARSAAPVDTGKLRDSIVVVQDGVLRFRLIANTPYAYFVEVLNVPYLRPQLSRIVAGLRGLSV